MSAAETVDFIIEKRCSVSRYGDGEFSMIYNLQDKSDKRKYGFQAFNKEMAIRLEEILKEGYNVDDNHYVALPGCMFSSGTGYLCPSAATFWQGFTALNIRRTIPMLNKRIKYLETNFSRFYLSHKDKRCCRIFIEHVKQIWANRDVIIVEGEKTRLGVGNDLFDTAKSIKRILCPATNAWGKYDEIIDTTLQITPPILIC
jgi:glycosyltransferase family protein